MEGRATFERKRCLNRGWRAPEQATVLLDEMVPERLGPAFSDGFIVEAVRYQDRAGMRSGDLLQAAEASFDALLTVDKGLVRRRSISERSIWVVVLDAKSATSEQLEHLAPLDEKRLCAARAGEIGTIRDFSIGQSWMG